MSDINYQIQKYCITIWSIYYSNYLCHSYKLITDGIGMKMRKLPLSQPPGIKLDHYQCQNRDIMIGKPSQTRNKDHTHV